MRKVMHVKLSTKSCKENCSALFFSFLFFFLKQQEHQSKHQQSHILTKRNETKREKIRTDSVQQRERKESGILGVRCECIWRVAWKMTGKVKTSISKIYSFFELSERKRIDRWWIDRKTGERVYKYSNTLCGTLSKWIHLIFNELFCMLADNEKDNL